MSDLFPCDFAKPLRWNTRCESLGLFITLPEISGILRILLIDSELDKPFDGEHRRVVQRVDLFKQVLPHRAMERIDALLGEYFARKRTLVSLTLDRQTSLMHLTKPHCSSSASIFFPNIRASFALDKPTTITVVRSIQAVI